MEERIIKDINDLLAQLFQKMKEAEYEWNADVKKLNKVEQKPDWSEEDEKMVNDIIAAIDTLHYHGMVNWLKTLKDRVQPQPKQEWSEEDEGVRKRVVGILEGWMSTFKETSYAEDCKCGIEWLKSLKPQNKWKPSDEQMKVLISEVKAWTKGCPKQKVLESLYNDLKKLKG